MMFSRNDLNRYIASNEVRASEFSFPGGPNALRSADRRIWEPVSGDVQVKAGFADEINVVSVSTAFVKNRAPEAH